MAFLGEALAAPAFPVKYSTNRRYLVDQNGVPFPILGRTAWFVTSLSASNQHVFVDDTVARGYTAIEFHVVNHDPRGNNPPFGGNGSLPFLKRLDGSTWTGALGYGDIASEAPDFTTPNETYWNAVDQLLAYCESKGVLVFLFPAYVGFQGGEQGWLREMVANGSARMQSYGAWIAGRYKDQKNIVWMMGGDMGTPPFTFDAAQTSVESALMTGLKSVAGQQSRLFSAEWTSESIATDQANFGPAMTLNGVYTFSGYVSYHCRRAYAHDPVAPAFLLEEPFDEEGPDGNPFGTGVVNPSAIQPVRRFQWWGWLSTIGGYVAGNGYVWPFNSGSAATDWRNHLDTQGSRDNARLNAFISSIAWHKLVPSGLGGMKILITSGGSAEYFEDFVTSAAAPDGTLLVAYLPPAHSGDISVDMTALNGPARARWFDPTSARYSNIGTGLTNAGSFTFTPPGNNSAGAKDWVLVLDRPDNTKPALRVTSPTTAASFTNTTGAVNLAGTASASAGLSQVTWSNDRGGAGVAAGLASWNIRGLTLAPGLNQITVAATDLMGNSTQAVLSATYLVPPFFISQPQSQLAATNAEVRFTVEAGGDSPLRYQWRRNGGNIPGATNDSYTITNVTPARAGYYSVVVANNVGRVTSSNALLKVFIPPLLVRQPVNRVVTAGRNTYFRASASGTTPLFYQWHKDGELLPGATNRTLMLYSNQPAAAGSYSVVVSNFAGVRASSNATLTVNVPPQFLAQPQSQSALLGGAVTFMVLATGTEPLRYQWRRNGSNLAGATNASYSILSLTNSQLGSYSVVVANVAGKIVSSNAVLSLQAAPAFARASAPGVPPVLNASVSEDGLILSWDTNAADFRLETTTDLEKWETLLQPAPSAGVFSVTNSMNRAQGFYRLAK